MENYHARFLGGKGVVTPLTYPVSLEKKEILLLNDWENEK